MAFNNFFQQNNGRLALFFRRNPDNSRQYGRNLYGCELQFFFLLLFFLLSILLLLPCFHLFRKTFFFLQQCGNIQ